MSNLRQSTLPSHMLSVHCYIDLIALNKRKSYYRKVVWIRQQFSYGLLQCTKTNDLILFYYSEERSHEEWLSLLRKQASQHRREIQAWKKTLQTVTALIKQVHIHQY